MCTEVLDVVAIWSPGISIPAESVFPACWNYTRLGRGGDGLSALVPGTLPFQCSNCLDIYESLDSSSCNGSSYPISYQDLLVLVTWTNVPSLSTPSPVDPLTGAHWEGLALQEYLEECKYCTWSGWSHGPDPNWGELNYSSSYCVGGWDVCITNSQLPNCLLFLCKPQSYKYSCEGCSLQQSPVPFWFLCLLGQEPKNLKQVWRVLFCESSWSNLYREIFQIPCCTLSFLDQIVILHFSLKLPGFVSFIRLFFVFLFSCFFFSDSLLFFSFAAYHFH